MTSRLCLLFLWLGSLIQCGAANSLHDFCFSCGKAIERQAYRVTKRGSEEIVIVCSDCIRLETVCYICGVPVKNNILRLADGRILCADDTRTAILEEEQAEKIFDEVKGELQSMLSRLGSLPDHNITLHLDAKARLDKTGKDLISTHDDSLLMGLTRSRSAEEGKFEHEVHLLYGLTRQRLKVVSAHEFGHTWLHENVSRKMNSDAIEGFCEWIAYRLISGKDTNETKVLWDSRYSRGQLQAFVAAENQHGFYNVMQWVKHGRDPEIDPEELDRILELRPNAPASFATHSASTPFGFAPQMPRTAPTNLVLKGLSGPKTRRFALINDGTFQVNDQARVRLGTSNVTVRCLQILEDAVVIQVAGETELRTLRLSISR